MGATDDHAAIATQRDRGFATAQHQLVLSLQLDPSLTPLFTIRWEVV